MHKSSAIFLVCTFLLGGASSIASASEVRPPLCPIEEFNSGVKTQTGSEYFTPRKRTITIEPDNKTVAYRIRVRAKHIPGSDDWSVELKPRSENECAAKSDFLTSSSQFSESWTTLLSPEYCGDVRVQATITTKDRKTIDDINLYLDVFEGARRSRQLSIVDADPAASPNWCQVDQFQGVRPTVNAPPSSDGFIYKDETLHRNFLTALDGIVLIGMTFAINPFAENVRSPEKKQILTSCSGFYITNELILTNRHCICPAAKSGMNDSYCSGYESLPDDGLTGYGSIDSYSKTKLVAFDWRIWSRTDTKGSEVPTAQHVDVVAMGKSYRDERPETAHRSPLDYAILRTPRNDSAKPVKLFTSKSDKGEPLSLLQYPGSQSLAINYDLPCQVIFEQGTPLQDYHGIDHGCDSAGGSSGSPLFSRDMSHVVGVHFCCGDADGEKRLRSRLEEGKSKASDEFPEERLNWNRAAPIGAILKDIQKEHPELFSEIMGLEASENSIQESDDE